MFKKIKTGNLKSNNINKNLNHIYNRICTSNRPSKAKELVEKHKIYTINQLKKSQHLLNDKQKLALKYYDELMIPIH